MRIAVSVESTVDLTKSQLEKYDISVIPYQVVCGNDTYKDGEITAEQLFQFVEREGKLPKTNALNEFEYTEYFSALKEKYDAVIHISLSSGATSSTGNAIRASKSLENVFVVDSLSLSGGIALLAIYARELAQQGLEAEDIFQKVSNRVNKVQASFVIERLDYLYKGGRCSSLQLLGANILKIRPRIVLKDGKMSMDKKYRGATMDKVLEKYGADIFVDYGAPDLKRAIISYTVATPEMLAEARKICEKMGFEEVLEGPTGATVASHCGANTMGIMYFLAD